MTKTVDNIISKSIQEIANDYVTSKFDYVEPRENPIATVPNDEMPVRNFGETFSCDVDGKHTEITIPTDAWDARNETVWLTQAQLAELYCSSVQNVGYHIGNILEDEELQADSVIKESFITASDGKSYRTKLYNLDMLLSLGYRIKSKVAIKFRQWATKHLKELMTKGQTEIETQTQRVPDSYMIEDPIERAKRWIEEQAEKKQIAAERDEALKASDQSFKARATAMGRLSNIRFRENDVKASERMAAYGHQSRDRKFTVQNVMDAAWFQILFKASQSERFYNGNPAWKPIIKSLKRLLSLKANNVVRHELENRFHGELSSTKARKVFGLWMKAKEGGTPFHESLAEIDLGEMATSLSKFIDELVCLSERYEYRRCNGDMAYGIVYGYAYDVWARVLSSLYFLEIEDYLRDTVEPEDFENTLYSVRSECYGLR